MKRDQQNLKVWSEQKVLSELQCALERTDTLRTPYGSADQFERHPAFSVSRHLCTVDR